MGTLRHFPKVEQGLDLTDLKLAKTEMTLASAAFTSYGKKQPYYFKWLLKNTVYWHFHMENIFLNAEISYNQ